jgi:peptidoglycan/LPS O-acetylase OafA/YrhL
MNRILRPGRVDELEGVRALLAWWVVLGHYYAAFTDRFDALHNQSAVSVFIILSGFVITALRRGKPESYMAFMTRRAFRLLPVYLLLLTLSAVTLRQQYDGIAHFAHQTAHNLGRADIFDVTRAHLSAQFVWHVVLLQGIVPPSWLPMVDYGILGQAWSLSVEWQFYLMAPLLIYLITARRWLPLSTITAGLTALHWLPQLRQNGAFISHQVAWFAIGIGCYFLLENRERVLARPLSWALVVSLAVYGLAFHNLGALCWAIVFPALFSKAQVFRWIARVLVSPILTRLGKVSYSTYLVHMLPFYFGMFALERLHWTGPLADTALVTGSVLFTLAISLGLYTAVERPGMDLGARLARRWFSDKRPRSLALETATGP